MKFKPFLKFCKSLCPTGSGSGSGFRIHWPELIWIRNSASLHKCPKREFFRLDLELREPPLLVRFQLAYCNLLKSNMDGLKRQKKQKTKKAIQDWAGEDESSREYCAVINPPLCVCGGYRAHTPGHSVCLSVSPFSLPLSAFVCWTFLYPNFCYLHKSIHK